MMQMLDARYQDDHHLELCHILDPRNGHLSSIVTIVLLSPSYILLLTIVVLRYHRHHPHLRRHHHHHHHPPHCRCITMPQWLVDIVNMG